MQPTALQITVCMAIGLLLIVLFAATEIKLTSTTTVSVSRPRIVSTTTRTTSQISQVHGTFSNHQEFLRGSSQRIDVAGVDSVEIPRVSVRVYVEALCPDSARFVVYDLASDRFPSRLWDIVDINYIFWVCFCWLVVYETLFLSRRCSWHHHRRACASCGKSSL